MEEHIRFALHEIVSTLDADRCEAMIASWQATEGRTTADAMFALASLLAALLHDMELPVRGPFFLTFLHLVALCLEDMASEDEIGEPQGNA